MTQTVFSPGAPAWFRQANRGLDGVASLFQAVAVAMLAAMLAINLANIIIRNVGLPSLLWVSPWTGLLMVWSVFLAFYVMYRRHQDIVLMILVGRFGDRGIKLSRILTALAGLLLVGVLLVEAPQILKRQRGTLELIGLTRYSLSIPLLLSSAFLLLHFLLDLVGIFRGWNAPKAPEVTAPQGDPQW